LYGLSIGFFTLNGLDGGNWRALIFWTSLPGILTVPLSIMILEESPLYLLMNGEDEKAFKILE